jgi:hypothetical protein
MVLARYHTSLAIELNMAEHKSAIEDFGTNDDFWLFGYGYVPMHDA